MSYLTCYVIIIIQKVLVRGSSPLFLMQRGFIMDLEKLKIDLEQFLKPTDYELYNLELKKTKDGIILTVYIDREEGITIEDCVIVTKELNPFLDDSF